MRLGVIVFFLFWNATSAYGQSKSYQKNYFKNGEIKSEGWNALGKKIDYWLFYYPSGKIKTKGHYCNGIACKYWFFYTLNGELLAEGNRENGKRVGWWKDYKNGKLSCKTQYQKGEKHGYSIVYLKGNMVKAIKYIRDKKINEWTDYPSFKSENSELFK